MNSIKRFIYHHDFLAKLYNIKRTRGRNKYYSMPDEEFAKMHYMQKRGKELNLESPKTFDEKIWYLKIHNRDPLLRKCTDKYLVREYVKECGLGNILNELYGVYDRFEDIDFSKLPDRCILKCNHTSGTNAIYDRSGEFDYKYQKNEFDFFMNRDS